jgi:hypothetical protein
MLNCSINIFDDDSYYRSDLKTHFVYNMLRKYSFINISLILGFTFYYLTSYYSDEYWNASCWYKMCWLFALPYTISSFIGLALFRTNPLNPAINTKDITLYILSVTKGTNSSTIIRALNDMSYIKDDLKINGVTVKHYLVLDEPCDPIYFDHGIKIVCVPQTFNTRNAKYKARALEYFRKYIKLENKDWILHLDEESVLLKNDLYHCIDFILEGTYKWGQGVILYNSYEYFKNTLLTVLDAIRVGDDLARFTLQYSILHKPVFGAHGSFLLVNGEVENTITWDDKYSKSLIEDFAFAMRCSDLGYKCGQVTGIVREVSPQSLSDFVKQRRRWFCGIWELPAFYARSLAILWSLSPITILVSIFHIPYNYFYPFSTPFWLDVLSSFSFVVCIYIYLIGIYVQDLDLKLPFYKRVYHLIIGGMLIPICACIESYAILYSLLYPAKTFDVIKKN